MRVIKRIFKIIIIFIFFVAIYTTYIERNLLTVENFDVESGENFKKSLKIVQFSDTQLGDYFSLKQLNKVVDKINKQNPDIIIFTGDLIDDASKYDDLYNVEDVLSNMNAKIGKYAVYGNHDYGGGAEHHYEKIMKNSGFTVLKNQNVKINYEDKNIDIFGADEWFLGSFNVTETMKNINESNFNILLIHEPDLIDKFKEYPIDIAFAGHSHGGQVEIPFYGPLIKTTLAEKYVEGEYKVNNKRGTELFVNTGLGNTKVPFRFNNIPTINVYNVN